MTIGHFQSTILISKGLNISIAALSNNSSNHFIDSDLVYAGVAFSTDGIVYDVGPGNADRTQFDPGEWYPNEPVANIGAFYDVRWASLSTGTAWDFQAASVTTWIQLTAERSWRNNVLIMNAPDVSTTSGVFEISQTGAATAIASATYSGEASN